MYSNYLNFFIEKKALKMNIKELFNIINLLQKENKTCIKMKQAVAFPFSPIRIE